MISFINFLKYFKLNKKEANASKEIVKKSNTLVSKGSEDIFSFVEENNKVTVKDIVFDNNKIVSIDVDVYGSNFKKIKKIEKINENILNIMKEKNIKANKKINKYIKHNRKILDDIIIDKSMAKDVSVSHYVKTVY